MNTGEKNKKKQFNHFKEGQEEAPKGRQKGNKWKDLPKELWGGSCSETINLIAKKKLDARPKRSTKDTSSDMYGKENSLEQKADEKKKQDAAIEHLLKSYVPHNMTGSAKRTSTSSRRAERT